MRTLNPAMIRRQILLIKKNFTSYPSSDEDTELRISEAIKSRIWPLVNHISSFDYPREFSQRVFKLCHFPFDKNEEEKWLNDFAYEVNNERMTYHHTFTEQDAINIQSTLGEIMNTLKAIQTSIPFIMLSVEDHSEKGEIRVTAIDKIMQEHNLVRTVGGTD